MLTTILVATVSLLLALTGEVLLGREKPRPIHAPIAQLPW
jgi:hypothetical protein